MEPGREYIDDEALEDNVVKMRVNERGEKLCNKPGCYTTTEVLVAYCRRHVAYLEEQIQKRLAAQNRLHEASLARESNIKRKHELTMDLLTKKEHQLAVKRAHFNGPKFVAYVQEDTYIREVNTHDPILKQLVEDMKERDRQAARVSNEECKKMDAYMKKVKEFAEDNSLNEPDAHKIIIGSRKPYEESKDEVNDDEYDDDGEDNDNVDPSPIQQPQQASPGIPVTQEFMAQMFSGFFNQLTQVIAQVIAPPHRDNDKTEELIDVDTDEEIMSNTEKLQLSSSPPRERLHQID